MKTKFIAGFSAFIVMLTAPFMLRAQIFEPGDTSLIRLQAIGKLVETDGHIAAVEELNQILNLFPNHKRAKPLLGKAWFKAKDYEQCFLQLNQAKKNYDTSLDTEEWFMLGVAAYRTDRMQDALKAFQRFESMRPRYQKAVWNELAAVKLAITHRKSIDTLLSHFQMDTTFEFPNSAYADFSPLIVNDSTVLFSSLRSDTLVVKEIGQPEFNTIQIYKYSSGAEKLNEVKLQKSLQKPAYHTANGCFSPDGKKFFYTLCLGQQTGNLKCKLMMAEIDKDGKFKKGKALPENINKVKYSNSQPYCVNLNLQGVQQTVLFFVSNRRGGYGGTDIWYSLFSEKRKRFGKPIHAGNQINSPGNERCPFYDTLNQKFYFSSDFFPGFGGLDVFVSGSKGLLFEKPKNLGKPINSAGDDHFFTLSGSGMYGFLASNRAGSTLLDSVFCCEDIFRFKLKTTPLESIDNELLASIDSMLLKAENLEITASIPEKEDSIHIELATKEEALPKTEVVNDSKAPDPESSLALKRISNRLKFATNSFELNDNFSIYLDSLSGMLQANTNLQLELIGHTDNTGSQKLNLQLSKRRAETIKAFLTNAGISPEKITANGKGSASPLLTNFNKDGSRNEAHQAANRRVTITITNIQ